MSVAPEVSTSSISTILRPQNRRARRLWYGESALHILGPLRAAEADLRPRRLDALERKRIDARAARRRDGLGQRIGLVEPAPHQPPEMQRHRHQQIGFGQQLHPGPGHPAPERLGQFHPVAIFQPVDQVAHRAILETRDGTGAVIDGRIGDRLRRLQAGDAEIIGKGRAEPLAIGLLDETDGAPAGRTERAMRRHRRPANEAGGRKDYIERGLGQRPALPPSMPRPSA